MIVRKTLTWLVFIGILCRAQADGERWSRQISNSEWIPLTNPRGTQRNPSPVVPAVAAVTSVSDSNAQAAGPVPVLSLPPALQQQYQEQLLQLQKTQESIQRLLLLQQQLKAQQHILESQAYQPNGFANAEDQKQALHQSAIVNLQTLPELAPEVLVPPVPSSEALPPVFRAQDFHPNTELKREHGHRSQQHAAASSPTSSEQDYRQTHDESIPRGTSRPREDSEKDYRPRQKSHYESSQRHKEEPSHVNFVTPATSSVQDGSDEQEEIQLVYVPAETLAQRGQSKLHRSQSRKHHPNRHHQHHAEISPTPISSHDAYAREILHQLQRQHEEKNKFLNNERQKEIARLQAEQKELERQSRIHQEMVRKEQEQMRQREAEKKRKELDKIEEASRQRELHRIHEIRERERQDERKLAELKAKEDEERRKELERFATYEREKDIRHQHEYEPTKEHDSRIRGEASHELQSHSYEVEHPNAQPLLRESQLHHQHLTEITNKNIKGSRSRSKPRNKSHHYHQQNSQEYQESTEAQSTTPSPNQPPLSVYMGNTLPNHNRIQLVDVLKTLKNARTIAVLDSFGPETPKVFVGPRNLDPPPGYAKFDLPYLSSIENNRVERKVDKLPFFVAPLSFEPPPGYSKIPFPAPHIGSVVINNLENVEIKPIDNPNPTPLIEPNSYVVSSQPLPAYDSTPVSYSQESSTPRYDVSSLPPSQSTTKWRFREFFDNKPSTEIPSVVTAASYHEERTPSSKFERPSKTRNYYNPNEVSTTPSYYSPKTVSAFSFEQNVPQSTPSYHEEPTRHHNVEPHLVDQNVGHHRQVVNRYHDSEPHQQTNQRYPVDPTGHPVTSNYYANPPSSYDDQAQYNLPAELPAISPQLPGLVNALVEKTEVPSTIQPPTTTPTTTTTTSTTTEIPTTTYRSRTRHRGRVSATRAATTTLSPPSRGQSERTRRPSSRSRSKYTTTTEEYHDSSYDPTRRNSVTTSRYDDQDSHVRRPTARSQSYKHRDDDSKESIQSQIVDSSASSEQGQRGNAYENVPLIDPASSSSSASHPSGGASTADLSIPVYRQDDYAGSTDVPIDNYSHRDSSISDSILPLSGLEYTRKSTHSSNYQTSPAYDQTGIDEQPVNGFNYMTHEVGSGSHSTRDFPYYRPGSTESVLFEPIATTDLPNVQRSQLQDFSPVYHAVPSHGQYEKNDTPRPIYRESAENSSEEEQPIFLPIPQDKQEEYSYQTTVTEVLPETTTTTTTTEAPVIIRQRVRGRLSGRTSQQQDSAIQTRPRGSQDEYVRFSAVNQDSSRTNSRQRSRPRTRTQQQQQQQQNSPIQTDGQEYVRIQSAPSQQRRTSTSTPPSSRTTDEPTSAEEEDYGFIRSPNYRPSQQQQPTNYKSSQTQSVDASEAAPSTEPSQSQAQILKNRQKYYSATRRPSSTRLTTTPRTTSTDDGAYTVRPVRTRTGYPAAAEDKTSQSKSRSRLRRPGARRRVTTTTTTTTTESALDAHNELPLDENYPRITPQQIGQDVHREDVQRDAYSDKIYEQAQLPVRAGSKRGQDLADENYPQEFLLNYGATQNFRRDEYDQAQLASDSPRRHQALSSASSRGRPTTSRSSSTMDIYGAESQWSTKLTGNSFQPSSYSPNQAADGSTKPLDNVGQEKAGDLPEIITAGPDVSSITVRVSSDDQNNGNDNKAERRLQEQHSSSSEESILDSMMGTMIDFGKKMTAGEESDTTITPSTTSTSTTTTTQASTENTQTAEVNKNGSATFKKAGLRRRRVRVRVRPAGSGSEDFVTAESQSYDSSFNSLPREANKFRNFYVTTVPTTTASATTTTTTTESPKTEKSVFEDFLDKMLGDNDETVTTNVPEAITTTTTTSPDEAWTSLSTIAPAAETSRDESTTLRDTNGFHRSSEYTTTFRSRDVDEAGNTEPPVISTTMIDIANEAYPSTSTDTVSAGTTTTTTSAPQRSEEVKSNSGENVIQSLNPENSLRYFVTKSPAFNEYLRSQEKKKTEAAAVVAEADNPDYPKNHRSKWSEVRYPTDKSLFDFAKWNGKNQSSGESRQNSGETAAAVVNNESDSATVTDYVKAIFESIKSADEEHHQSAKLADESTRQDKELFKTKNSSVFPTEVKTSVSSSSRVVARPGVSSSQESRSSVDATTTTMESPTFGPFVPSMMSDKQTGPVKKTPFETNLGKILYTTTTTKVSHMTEICYRGRCVMSKPKADGVPR